MISKHMWLYLSFASHTRLCLLLKANICCCCLVTQSCLTLVTPWTVAHWVPLSMGFPRQEYWSRLPFPSQGSCPRNRTCISCIGGRVLYHWATREPQNWHSQSQYRHLSELCNLAATSSIDLFANPLNTFYWVPTMCRHCVTHWEYSAGKIRQRYLLSWGR